MTQKCLEKTLENFGQFKIDEIKQKELILWKFINNEHGSRHYKKEIVFKTITTLFLCAYEKQWYSAATSADIKADKIVNEVLQHLQTLNKCKPTCHLMLVLKGESLIERLLGSGFSPHKD